MSPDNSFRKHLFISGIVLISLLLTLFWAWFFVRTIFENPRIYLNTQYTNLDIQSGAVFISILILCVLISYVVYLLMTSKSRTALIVWNETKGLLLSKEQFRMVYEAAPIPYVMLNENAEINQPNKATLRFFGVLPEELEGKTIFSFLSQGESEHGKKLLQSYKLNIPINREEVQMVTKTGEVRWVLISVFDMRDPMTRVRTGLASIFDITEQKKLSQSKTEFMSLASHQLRTPLATIKWYTDMLVSGGLGELVGKQKEYVSRVYAVNEDMIGLVDTLLNVSRMEIGTLAVEKKPTNVKDICEGIFTEVASQITKKNIQVLRKYEGINGDIDTDPKLLRIVIQNLVTNAVKYTPDGGTITVSLETVSGRRQIVVSDTGLGIPKAQQGKIFQKLFRADNVQNISSSQSTGLGLYLVKSLVETLGGDIKFKSEENKGSIFTITL